MSDHVKFEQRICADGNHQIAIVTLDNPSSLNALTFDMLAELHNLLSLWRDDPSIACILLEGEGHKAFCAGGDVRAMHDVMSSGSKAKAQEYCTSYFTLEYQCDFLIHTYPKPIIGWGEGIVMGGGMGLFMGSSHKIVTTNSRLAMPEVTIGLFPDVGGTWFLNRLDDGIGLFLGLTGAMVNASDAVDIRLADYILLAENRTRLIETLQIQFWPKESALKESASKEVVPNETMQKATIQKQKMPIEGQDDSTEERSEAHSIVSDVLSLLSEHAATDIEEQKPANQLMPFYSKIQLACLANDITHVCEKIANIDTDAHSECEVAWMNRAKQSLLSGSPITAHLCYRQINQYNTLSIADCFRLELGLSVNSALLGEFQEGVRARLIDKDNQPRWLYSRVEEVDTGVIDDLFMSLWEREAHPLALLGK